MRILIVDDEKDFVDMLQERLKYGNHFIDVAYNGKDALDLIKLKTYDIAFLDQNMPEMTGLELIKYIKTNNLAAKTVMVTSYPAIDEFFAKNTGADEYLIKPIKIKEVEDIIKKYCQATG